MFWICTLGSSVAESHYRVLRMTGSFLGAYVLSQRFGRWDEAARILLCLQKRSASSVIQCLYGVNLSSL